MGEAGTGAFSFWQIEGRISWKVVRGGERSVIEGFFGEFLKRRVKDFDRYFSTGSLENLIKLAFLLRLVPPTLHGGLLSTFQQGQNNRNTEELNLYAAYRSGRVPPGNKNFALSRKSSSNCSMHLQLL